MQKSLNDWLSHLETAHSQGLIDMGLARVGEVKHRMGLQPTCPVVVVAGTNGKGSVCAFLTQIYKQAGFKVGTLTSPHLLRFNERIALNGQPVDDDSIVAAFERIEAARGEISLTYFEFNTLAAVDIFIQAQVDVMILDVGLGGRLDAVNVFDADVAVVTSVDLDHQAFLGDTIEQVGFEKAGVFRTGKPAICGQKPPPPTTATPFSAWAFCRKTGKAGLKIWPPPSKTLKPPPPWATPRRSMNWARPIWTATA